MENKIISGKNAQKLLENGVNAVANLVKTTLGPKGKNVVIDRKFLSPIITNDGATIAKEVVLEDPCENMGVKLVNEVCQKTNDVSGDGTTTAIVLAQALLNEGLKQLSNGHNPIDINNGIRKTVENCVKIIKEKSKLIKSNNEIEQIATISSGISEIGKLIAEAKQKIGINGSILLQDSNTEKTTLSILSGMEFDRGYLSPYMCNDLEKMQVVYDDCLLLITDKKITSIQEILPILEQTIKTNKPLLIICDDMDDEVLSAIIVNKMKGTIKCAVVRAPLFGDKKFALLEDIASLCDTKVFSASKGDNLKDINVENLPILEKVKITKEATTIIPQANTQSALKTRIDAIKAQINDTKNEFEKEQLKIRLSKLTGGVATIWVGANTEVEQKELKLRIEDAINATNSACEMGIVAGGGITLLNCKTQIKRFITTLPKEERIGGEIVLKILSAPIKQILINAELNPETIIEKIERTKKENYGFNAKTNKYGDMLSLGVIDPTKVTITALLNATSVVTTMLTTNGLIYKE